MLSYTNGRAHFRQIPRRHVVKTTENCGGDSELDPYVHVQPMKFIMQEMWQALFERAGARDDIWCKFHQEFLVNNTVSRLRKVNINCVIILSTIDRYHYSVWDQNGRLKYSASTGDIQK